MADSEGIAGEMAGLPLSPGSPIREDISASSDEGIIEDALAAIKRVQGVIGAMVLNSAGELVRSTLPADEAVRRANTYHDIAKSAHALLADEEVQLLRLSTRNEMIVISSAPASFVLVVVQSMAAG